MNELLKKFDQLPNKIGQAFPPAIWHILVNSWSLTAMIIFAYEFLNGNPHGDLTIHLTIIYIGVLGIYVGTKEFRRWHNAHRATNYGEFFVLIWTIMMIVFVFMATISSEWHISHDLAATYIAVLSIFAITRESKRLREEDKKKDK